MKDAQFSSKAYGTHEYKELTIDGRIQFDLLMAIQRDYKLASYTLSLVPGIRDLFSYMFSSFQLCQPTSWNGTEETRRRLAVYCLKDAYLPQGSASRQLLGMFMYNYLEMARVTGVPSSFLLITGHSVKAKDRGYLVPNIKYSGPVTDGDVSLTPTGDYFVKSNRLKGILPEILEELLTARKRAKADLKKESDPFKRAVLDGRQLALKISANSVYGFTGATTTVVVEEYMSASKAAEMSPDLEVAGYAVKPFAGFTKDADVQDCTQGTQDMVMGFLADNGGFAREQGSMACQVVDRRRLEESARNRKMLQAAGLNDSACLIVLWLYLEVSWLDPMTEVEKISNDIGRAFSALAKNNCSEPILVIETKLIHTKDNVTSGIKLSCDDAEAIALSIMVSNGLGVQPGSSSCTVVEEPLPDNGEEAVSQSPEATSRAIMLPPPPPENDGGDSGFPIWAIVLIAVVALLRKKDKCIEEKNIIYEGDETADEIINNKDNPSSIGSGEGSSTAAVASTFPQLQKDQDKGLEDQPRASKSLAWASVPTPQDSTDGDAAQGETMLSSRSNCIAFPPPPTGIQGDKLWPVIDEQSEIIAGKSGSSSPDEEDDLTSTQSFSTEHCRMSYNPLVDLPTDSDNFKYPARSKSYAGIAVAALDSPREQTMKHKSSSQMRVTPVLTSPSNSRINPQHSINEPAHDCADRPSSSQPTALTKKTAKPVEVSPYNPMPRGKSLKGNKIFNAARSIISQRSSSSRDLKARARSSRQLTPELLSASSSQLHLKNGGSGSVDSGERGSARVS
eukprot:gene22627-29770_t